jgi:uncharacterized membrane protein (UPF0127 family)
MNPFNWIVSGLRSRFSSRSQGLGDARPRVSNLTRHTVLATCLEVANTSSKRNKGLLGRDSLPAGEGLWILPCEAVHTFWMQFPIDLIYLDRKNGIRKLVSDLPPWRLSACLTAHSVIELPAGTILRTQTQRGDVLDFSAEVTSGDSVGACSAHAE